MNRPSKSDFADSVNLPIMFEKPAVQGMGCKQSIGSPPGLEAYGDGIWVVFCGHSIIAG